MPFEYMVCFLCSEQCIQIISVRETCGLFCSVFKKIIPNTCNTTVLFKNWVG